MGNKRNYENVKKLNLLLLADLTRNNISIRYIPQKGFYVQFEGSSVLDFRKPLKCEGVGSTPLSAMNDYAKKIRGLTLVFPKKQFAEMLVPDYIEDL